MTKEASFLIGAWSPYIFGWWQDLWFPMGVTVLIIAYVIGKDAKVSNH